jgi:hypothetical protein
MEVRKRILGEEHPDTLISITHLASIYTNQGRWNEAEVLEEQVMEVRKRILGEEHPDTLISITHLASIYTNRERWNEAEALEVHVMEMRKEKFDEKVERTAVQKENEPSIGTQKLERPTVTVLSKNAPPLATDAQPKPSCTSTMTPESLRCKF